LHSFSFGILLLSPWKLKTNTGGCVRLTMKEKNENERLRDNTNLLGSERERKCVCSNLREREYVWERKKHRMYLLGCETTETVCVCVWERKTEKEREGERDTVWVLMCFKEEMFVFVGLRYM
jgi:hypothetical protein